eukprot:4864378-Pyramimonas_sp.AAC.2
MADCLRPPRKRGPRTPVGTGGLQQGTSKVGQLGGLASRGPRGYWVVGLAPLHLMPPPPYPRSSIIQYEFHSCSQLMSQVRSAQAQVAGHMANGHAMYT